MARFLGRRFVYSIGVFIATSIIVFGLSRAAGDPRHLFLTEYTTTATWEAWGREYGLDRPFIVQYVIWMGKAVRGNFGNSLTHHINARQVIQERFPATMQLTVSSFIGAMVIGVPLGVLSAVQRGTVLDYIGRSWALIGQALAALLVGRHDGPAVCGPVGLVAIFRERGLEKLYIAHCHPCMGFGVGNVEVDPRGDVGGTGLRIRQVCTVKRGDAQVGNLEARIS